MLTDTQIFAFVRFLGHWFGFVLHLIPGFLCVSPSLCFLVLAGVEKEIMWETVLQPVSHPPLSGRAGSSMREPILMLFPAVGCTAFLPAFLPPLPFRGRRKHGEAAGLGAESHFSNFSTGRATLIAWNRARLLQKSFRRSIFLRCLFLKYLSNKGGGMQLLADCCAGLLKDQRMWTCWVFNLLWVVNSLYFY